VLVAAAVAAGCFGWVVPVAEASYPGRNGDIAFTRNEVGDSIYVVGPDGTGLRQLPLTGTSPSWSPDGRRIAYCVDEDVGPFGEIRVADADGQHARKLVSYLNRYGCDQPTWSPDRRRIAFTARRAIFTAAVKGGARRALTRPSDEFGNYPTSQQPAWSPRGDRIAWARYSRSGAIDIWTMKPDGSRKRRLTHSPPDTQASRPIWSPGGRRIIYTRFTSTQGSFEEGVYVMNRDGTRKRRLGGVQRVAAWSPDGRLLATVGAPGGALSDSDGIWIAALDGSGQRRLTDPLGERRNTTYFGPVAYDSQPDWQPLPR
jgi:Tol biopolymer transport system component